MSQWCEGDYAAARYGLGAHFPVARFRLRCQVAHTLHARYVGPPRDGHKLACSALAVCYRRILRHTFNPTSVRTLSQTSGKLDLRCSRLFWRSVLVCFPVFPCDCLAAMHSATCLPNVARLLSLLFLANRAETNVLNMANMTQSDRWTTTEFVK
jgi:hypothetical protein